MLLLACRMALFALLAFGPGPAAAVLPTALGAAVGGGPRAVVLVLDDSASMGYAEDGQTLLDRAREAARKVVAGAAARRQRLRRPGRHGGRRARSNSSTGRPPGSTT